MNEIHMYENKEYDLFRYEKENGISCRDVVGVLTEQEIPRRCQHIGLS